MSYIATYILRLSESVPYYDKGSNTFAISVTSLMTIREESVVATYIVNKCVSFTKEYPSVLFQRDSVRMIFFFKIICRVK